MVEEWWSSVLNGDCIWLTHNTEVCISYTRGTRGQDRVQVKLMINLVLVKKDMLQYVQDVRAVRGMG